MKDVSTNYFAMIVARIPRTLKIYIKTNALIFLIIVHELIEFIPVLSNEQIVKTNFPIKRLSWSIKTKLPFSMTSFIKHINILNFFLLKIEEKNFSNV